MPSSPLRNLLALLARAALASVALACLAPTPVRGDDAARARWVVSFGVGGVQTAEESRAYDANVLTLVNEQGEAVDRFIDPRPDEGATRRLEASPATLAFAGVGLESGDHLALGLTVGWFQSDVGDVGVYHYDSGTADRVAVGELTRVPIRLDARFRFRPGRRLRPYLGAGTTYTVAGFEPSPELDLLSVRVDLSTVQPAYLTTEQAGNRIIRFASDPTRQLSAARVEASDAFGWDAIGGFEGSAGHWTAFVELDWAFTTNELRVSFDGADELGLSVPQGSTPRDSIEASAPYGGVYTVDGGFLDVDGDGTPERGIYYVSGGAFGLGGPSIRLGARYRFGD